MTITTEQVSQLAPDGGSASAGQKLKALKHWSELGINTEALWGKCQGSALYQVRVDLANLGSTCSCPSRKFPCKHALGLLFLYAESPAAVPQQDAPEWVNEWLSKRRDRAVKKAEKQADQADKPVDEKAQQKRAEQREARVSDGLERLDLWMRDLVRNGLAGLESKPPAFWDEQARRLVDAQAAGLASRLAALGELPGRHPDWPEQMLMELGRLKLLIHAWQRMELISAPLQSDIRQMIGWNIGQDELAKQTNGVEDLWAVVGQATTEEKQLRVQRSWLLGRQTGQWALVIQFAAGSQPFPESFLVGTEQAGRVIYYPGAAQQRATLVRLDTTISQVTERLPGTDRMEEFLSLVSSGLTRQPWLRSTCGLFRDATLVPRHESWMLCDHTRQGLPLAGKQHWKLLALSGGSPFDLAAEWDGRRLTPLGLMIAGRFRSL